MEPLSLTLSPPPPVYAQERPGPSLLAVIRRRRRLGITVFLLMLAITGICALLIPRAYHASMEFIVNNDRVITPVGTDGSSMQAIVYMNDINEARINTEVSLLSSNDLMLKVVRQAGLAERERGSLEVREEVALKRLKATLSVAPLRRSAVIAVGYASDDRQTGLRVLDVLSALYMDAHLRLSGHPGVYSVFEKLWKDASAQRSAAETALSTFKRDHNVVSIPEERTIALQREAELRRQYSDATVAARKAEKQTEEFGKILASTPPNIVGEQKTIPNQGELEHLQSVLAGLQLKRVEAASRYQPGDRTITDLDQEISQTEESLASARSHNAQELSMVSNPVLHDAEAQENRVLGEYAGYQEEAKGLGRELSAARQHLLTLDGDMAAYNRLNEDVTQSIELDKSYRQKLDAARLEKTLDEDHVSNVAISEPPFVSTQRFPRLETIVTLGVVWSFISSLIAILTVDRARTRVTSPIDVERAFGAPVIAAVGTTAATNLFGFLPPAYSQILREPSNQLRRVL